MPPPAFCLECKRFIVRNGCAAAAATSMRSACLYARHLHDSSTTHLRDSSIIHHSQLISHSEWQGLTPLRGPRV